MSTHGPHARVHAVVLSPAQVRALRKLASSPKGLYAYATHNIKMSTWRVLCAHGLVAADTTPLIHPGTSVTITARGRSALRGYP